LPELYTLPVNDLLRLLNEDRETGTEPPTPEARSRTLARAEIMTRLRYLQQVGLGYLSLDRPSKTLLGRRSAARQSHQLPRHLRWSTPYSCSMNPASACIRATSSDCSVSSAV
jgi:hypothetical protein